MGSHPGDFPSRDVTGLSGLAGACIMLCCYDASARYKMSCTIVDSTKKLVGAMEMMKLKLAW